MAKYLSHLIYGGVIATTLLYADVSKADYCNGPNFCTTNRFGYTYACYYNPNICGYGYGYGRQSGFYISLPFFFGNDHHHKHHHRGHHHR